MIIGIHQPNFLPWISYFHKIKSVDKFVFLDDVQIPRGKSYCSRTKILIQNSEAWLTIPILNKSEMLLIKDVKVNNNLNWKKKHLRTLELNYRKSLFFHEVIDIINNVYEDDSEYLIDYNMPLITKISQYLDLKTEFIKSSEISLNREITGLEKILEINKILKSDSYLSGSGRGSQRYIDEARFKPENINLIWQEFVHSTYPQLSKNFIRNLSIIDLLFNCGKNSSQILNGISLS